MVYIYHSDERIQRHIRGFFSAHNYSEEYMLLFYFIQNFSIDQINSDVNIEDDILICGVSDTLGLKQPEVGLWKSLLIVVSYKQVWR